MRELTYVPEDVVEVGWCVYSLGFGKVVDLDVSSGDGSKAEDFFSVDGDVGGANVMSELVLTGKMPEETVEVDVA